MAVAHFLTDPHLEKHLSQTVNQDCCKSNSNSIDQCMEWKKFLRNVGNSRKRKVATGALFMKKTVKQCVPWKKSYYFAIVF